MRLLLSMLTWPDGTKPEIREIDGELAIGRGRESNWTLPDPANQISRRHCLLTPFGEGWRVTDLSQNGTFINEASTPLGRQQSYELHDGDRIRLGAYVIEARYQAPASLAGPNPDHASFAFPPIGHDTPAASPLHPWEPNAWSAASPPGSGGFGPRAGAFPDDFIGQPSADHSPAVSDAWQVPPPNRVVIPEDWDLEEMAHPIARAASPASPVAPAMPPAFPIAPAATHASPVPPAAPPTFADTPAAVPTAQGLPPGDDWLREDPAGFEPAQIPATPVDGARVGVGAAIVAPMQQSPSAPPALAPSSQRMPMSQPGVAPPVQQVPESPPTLPSHVQPASPTPEPAAAATVASDAAQLAAFLRGAGLRDTGDADPLAMMEAVGRMVRVMVDRLREVQANRSTIKREFRILATMVSPDDNNPIKFSATNEAAVRSLLTGKRPPDRSVGELLDEIRLHELAMIAAMRDAVRGLLEELNPAHLRATEHSLASMLPVQRKARAFDQYEALHARIVQALADNFDSVFGKAFARAYERVALDEEKPPMGTRR